MKSSLCPLYYLVIFLSRVHYRPSPFLLSVEFALWKDRLQVEIANLLSYHRLLQYLVTVEVPQADRYFFSTAYYASRLTIQIHLLENHVYSHSLVPYTPDICSPRHTARQLAMCTQRRAVDRLPCRPVSAYTLFCSEHAVSPRATETTTVIALALHDDDNSSSCFNGRRLSFKNRSDLNMYTVSQNVHLLIYFFE